MLVAVFAAAVIGKALVRESAPAGVGADAQDFSARAHVTIGGVVEDVGFESAGGIEMEPGGFETLRKAGKVVHAEFDFGFHRDHNLRVYGMRCGCLCDGKRLAQARMRE